MAQLILFVRLLREEDTYRAMRGITTSGTIVRTEDNKLAIEGDTVTWMLPDGSYRTAKWASYAWKPVDEPKKKPARDVRGASKARPRGGRKTSGKPTKS